MLICSLLHYCVGPGLPWVGFRTNEAIRSRITKCCVHGLGEAGTSIPECSDAVWQSASKWRVVGWVLSRHSRGGGNDGMCADEIGFRLCGNDGESDITAAVTEVPECC